MEVERKGTVHRMGGDGTTASNPVLDEATVLTQELNNAWWSKQTHSEANLRECGFLLAKIKPLLVKLKFLPLHDTEATKKELGVARNVLEVGATWSIAMKDIPSFERYMAQLKPYYLDYKQLEDSSRKYELLGLNLLCHLSQNRIAAFHTELELLPPEAFSRVYISHPVSLEQHMTEGSYNKIFVAKGNVPAASYNFFMDILVNTVRDEMCSCMEKAYEQLSLCEVATMLKIDTNEAKVLGSKLGWKLSFDGCYHFRKDEQESKAADDVFPTSELVAQTIEYAKELEKIV